jgi:tyrosyl-DNA phosphodiesterase-1
MSIQTKPTFKVVFPTADEIRRSLNGYASGGSIHTKIQSPQQEKQLQYLRPHFCHWANDAPNGRILPADCEKRDGGRKRAAPHIKTYIRYAMDTDTIDWALLTSANLSKQAWGDVAMKSGEVRVASWEIGVLLWPALLTGEPSTMVATFKTDAPRPEETEALSSMSVVGLRVPYNIPLQHYGSTEVPWVASMVHREPDWAGHAWGLD